MVRPKGRNKKALIRPQRRAGSAAAKRSLEEAIPNRLDLCLYADRLPFETAQQFAHDIVGRGLIQTDDVESLAQGLYRAAMWYFLGQWARESEKENKAAVHLLTRQRKLKDRGPVSKQMAEFVATFRERGLSDAGKILKLPPQNRSPEYADQAFIAVMAIVYQYFGGKPGTAWNADEMRETDSRFQRLCKEWLKKIDPTRNQRRFPTKPRFVDAIKRAKQIAHS